MRSGLIVRGILAFEFKSAGSRRYGRPSILAGEMNDAKSRRHIEPVPFVNTADLAHNLYNGTMNSDANRTNYVQRASKDDEVYTPTVADESPYAVDISRRISR